MQVSAQICVLHTSDQCLFFMMDELPKTIRRALAIPYYTPWLRYKILENAVIGSAVTPCFRIQTTVPIAE